jgi:hypothetical protein
MEAGTITFRNLMNTTISSGIFLNIKSPTTA